jgi:hypothetical protein
LSGTCTVYPKQGGLALRLFGGSAGERETENVAESLVSISPILFLFVSPALSLPWIVDVSGFGIGLLSVGLMSYRKIKVSVSKTDSL